MQIRRHLLMTYVQNLLHFTVTNFCSERVLLFVNFRFGLLKKKVEVLNEFKTISVFCITKIKTEIKTLYQCLTKKKRFSVI